MIMACYLLIGQQNLHNNMSRIRTNIITNRMANGAPTVSNGLVISGLTTTSDINVGTGVTLNVHGGATYSGIVTATQFKGDGSQLSGLASREVYGFTGIGKSLSLTTTNSGADNIDNATYVAFEESFIGPSGLSFSINTSGNLIMTV